ncbi:MAG: restriction endonuclease subunit S [Nanoarchaeota archaeon]
MKNKLPNGWIETKLEEVCELVTDGTHITPNYVNEGVPFISTINLQPFKKEFKFDKYRKFISKEEHSFLTKRVRPQRGDLLISKCGTIGVTQLVRENYDFSIFVGLMLVKVKRDKVLSEYLEFYFNNPRVRKELEVLSSGSSRATLTIKILKNYKILLPPLETQKQIVEILERAERLKEKRKIANELSAQYLKSIFYEMFGDPIRNNKKWEIRPLKEFGEIKTGNTPPRIKKEYYGDYIEWIKSDNLNNPSTYLTKAEEGLSKEGAKVGRVAPKRSILVTCIAGSPSCIGNAGIADRDVAFNQQINAIIPNKDINELFLYYLITYSKDYILNFSTQSMKGMISKGAFEKIPFVLPSKEVQLQFGEIANQIEKTRSHQKQSEEKINNLYNSLMQKAFVGDLIK